VYYQTLGAAPDRRFVVQWHQVAAFQGSGNATFQAVLLETSNCIEFRYARPLVENSPTVGIENAAGDGGFPGGFGPDVEPGDCVVFCPAGSPCPDAITASIDIKPGVCPNPFHLTGNPVATLAVAIVGAADLDVSQIDPASILVSRTDGAGGSVAPLSAVVADVSTAGGSVDCQCGANSGDGVLDLLLQFQRTQLQSVLEIGADDAGVMFELEISGAMKDGTPISGTDCVIVE
jgi:hypothetical protein